MTSSTKSPVDSRSKIVPLDELARRIEAAKEDGARVALCHGVFDLLHPGHIRHLQEARNHGDLLVVTVTADRHVNKGPGRPAFPERTRMESLAALDCVAFVSLSEAPTAVGVIEKLRPTYYVKGMEYANAEADLTGKIGEEIAAVRAAGGDIRYTDGEVHSSSSLINRFFSTAPTRAQAYLDEFRMRHSIDEILQHLKDVADLRVLLIGDVIIDQYHYCHALAKSPREMTPAARFVSMEQFAGGSLAVANHLAGLCKEVTLIATMGPEEELQHFARSHLRSNVDFVLHVASDRPTTVKRRFLESTFLQKMFEIQMLDDTPYDSGLDDGLVKEMGKHLSGHDLVIISDFGHGLLTPSVRNVLQASTSFLAVNAQSNCANLGFNTLAKYSRADYACLHELELRLSMQSQYEPTPILAERTSARLRTRALAVTRGPNGILLLGPGGRIDETPAFSSHIVDRVGAGDTVFSATSPLVFKGCPNDIVGFVGNCAGALAVQTVCNREPIDANLLAKFITHFLR